jgi:hypothetical protein
MTGGPASAELKAAFRNVPTFVKPIKLITVGILNLAAMARICKKQLNNSAVI